MHRLLKGLMAGGDPQRLAKQQQHSPAYSWGEPHVMLLKSLLDLNPGPVLQQLHVLLPLLHEMVAVGAGASKLSRSVKCVQLISAMLAKAGSTLGLGQLQLLHRTVARTQTFMSKGLLGKIEGQVAAVQ